MNVVSFSGGKDSTAMLLRMIELGYQIDEVLNFDTGLEFPALYEHIAKVKAYVESKGIKFTILKADKTFEYYAFEHEYTNTKNGKSYKGYGWARGHSRWCTTLLKENLSRKYKKEHKGEIINQYIGIAYDEQYRLERKHNQQGTHFHPLVEWKWTEKDCLNYCYEKGYDFGGLYKLFDRVSCWCCPLQKLSELRKLWKNFPELWQQLKEWEKLTDMPFRDGYTIDMLEKRFLLEEDRENKGLSNNPHTKEFRVALKQALENTPPHLKTE